MTVSSQNAKTLTKLERIGVFITRSGGSYYINFPQLIKTLMNLEIGDIIKIHFIEPDINFYTKFTGSMRIKIPYQYIQARKLAIRELTLIDIEVIKTI